MVQLSPERLRQYRQSTYRLPDQSRLQSQADALAFVEERGFVFFWPIKGVEYPSLWAAVAGNRPVADAHDDPGHITWRWKDDMLDKRQWYYAKLLRGKATMISLAIAPYFYALSENYGDPEQDYLQSYEDGLLSREAKLIYETLLHEGPLDTVRLRRTSHMTSKASNSPFERGLTSLQRDFKILPTGIAEAGAWRYSFIYDLVARYYPDLPQQARAIGRAEARRKLLTLYFAAVGAATAGDVRKLFQWRKIDIQRALDKLVAEGTIQANRQADATSAVDFYVLSSLTS